MFPPFLAAKPAALEQWERELRLFGALRQLKLFRMYKLWKSFRIWRKAVSQHKFAYAKASLEKNLFLLSPVFQVWREVWGSVGGGVYGGVGNAVWCGVRG